MNTDLAGVEKLVERIERLEDRLERQAAQSAPVPGWKWVAGILLTVILTALANTAILTTHLTLIAQDAVREHAPWNLERDEIRRRLDAHDQFLLEYQRQQGIMIGKLEAIERQLASGRIGP